MARIAINTRLVPAMAVDAEGHVVQGYVRFYFRHRSDIPVALFAVDPLGNMRSMIEIHKVGDPIDLHPADRLLRLPRFADLDDLRLRCRHELMASHAGLHRRDVGIRSASCTAVTILAVDLVGPGMDRVAEGDRLARACLLARTAAEKHQSSQKQGTKSISYSDRRIHGCDFPLSAASSVALHGPRTPCFARTASTSSGFAAGTLFPHDDLAWLTTAAISSFESLS